jgi:chemotaxis protein histidine kinase CheA
MAGAIRLGELTHLMESRIEAAIEANAFSPELFAELEEKMDRLAPTSSACAPGPAEPQAPAAAAHRASDRTKVREAGRRCSPAAMLRVNADTLDHLINEAGEVAIARSRVEAELRLIAVAARPFGIDRPHARPAARGRGPGRQPDAVAALGAGRPARRPTTTRSSSTAIRACRS